MGFNDEPSDDDGEQGKVKVSFDKGLKEEMERISNKFPLECAPFIPTSKKGTASLITPPLTSNHFKASAALRNTAVSVAAAPPSTPAAPPPPPPPSTPAVPAVPPTPYPTPYPYGPLPFHLRWDTHHSCPTPTGTLWPPVAYAALARYTSGSLTHEDRLPDPPSSPAFSGGSLSDFLSRYPDLPAPTRAFLDDLGFEIGDDFSLVTEAQWKEGGFILFG
ncbi:hypothetical protein B0H14DRAFT_3445360 [Mycena olivaceomarginata]|nr:hypothetical protein B0H14DRAFT_3445360 [Mycena olivaceomarginata]